MWGWGGRRGSVCPGAEGMGKGSVEREVLPHQEDRLCKSVGAPVDLGRFSFYRLMGVDGLAGNDYLSGARLQKAALGRKRC